MNRHAARKRGLGAHLLLVAVALVWGTTFPLVKAALRDISPLRFNAFRMLLAAVLLLLANWPALQGLSRKELRLCALAGLLLALGYELQTLGLTRTTPSKSAFLTGLVVVLVPLLSTVPGLRTPGMAPPRPIAFLGALIAFLGIVFLTSEPAAGTALLAGMHWGEWMTLGCAVAFALHLLTLSRGAGSIGPRALGTLQIVAAGLLMLAVLPLDQGPATHWTWTVVWALLVTAVLATAAAFTIQSWAQQHLPATHIALIFTLEPVFAWLTSLLFLHERLGPRALFGAVLVLGGILLAELGPTATSGAGILPWERQRT